MILKHEIPCPLKNCIYYSDLIKDGCKKGLGKTGENCLAVFKIDDSQGSRIVKVDEVKEIIKKLESEVIHG